MRKSFFALGVLCLASTGLAQETGYATNWSGHRTQFINTSTLSPTATSISGNVVKYPMLVRLGTADSAIFAAAKSDGSDIRFTKSNNTTRLQHAIETWDKTARSAAIWVLVDTVYANNMTQNFRMHWGNASAADSSRPGAVFDSANGFVAVWHMGDASGATPRPNAVAGGNPATPAGNAVATGFVPKPGIIGMADTLRNAGNSSTVANEDHFTLGSGYEFAGGSGTLSMWINIQNFQSSAFVHFLTLSAGTSGGLDNNLWMGRGNTSTSNRDFRFRTSNGTVEGTSRTAAGALELGKWSHFTITFADSLGHTQNWYKNGVNIGSFTSTLSDDDINPVTRGRTYIGRSAWGDRSLRGLVDEVRISKVARSADWVKLDYASQNAAQALVTDSTAPSIAYAVDTLDADQGFPIAAILPTQLGGIPRPTVAISPALPAGLTFTTQNNANRGMISGTPTAAQALAMYVITATNGKGSVSDTIYVRVNANSENYSAWTNIRTLAFNSPASAALANFPFLVRLGANDSAVFAQAGAGGASLRFSRTDAVKLKYAIDQWDAVNRKAAIWVLMDQVTPGANTLRMHWGNGSATSQSNQAGVFSASNGYQSVWHMGDATGATPRANSVAGGNPATPRSSTANLASGFVPRPGAIGMADTVRGTSDRDSSDHFNLGSGYTGFKGKISLSAWVNFTGDTTIWQQYVSLGNGQAQDAIWFGREGSANNKRLAFETYNGNASPGQTFSVNGVARNNQWQFITVTNDDRDQRIYSNGLLVGGPRIVSLAMKDTVRTNNFIGRSQWPDVNATGLFDEVRISNVVRDSNWVRLEYATQAPGVAQPVLRYPAAVSGAPGAPISPVSPGLGDVAAAFKLSGSLPAGIAFDSVTGVFSGTPAGPGASTVLVTATSGVWSASAQVSLNFGAADGNYATAWSGHQYVSINAGDAPVGVNDTLRNFPILVRLGAADAAVFAASQRKGADIRFTKLNNVTRLQHEIEYWDSTGRSAAVWVKVDTVYGRTNGSRLRMHYGNATAADSSKPSAVFDSANGYLGVWHMGNVSANTDPRPNAVAGGFPATPAASAANLGTGFAPRAGLIGAADSLRGQNSGSNATAKGNDDHFNLGNSGYVFTGGQVTISMWLKLNDPIPTTSYHHFITFGNGTNNADNIWMGRIGNTNTFGQRSATANGESQTMEVEEALAPLGQWANFTITRAGTDGTTATSYKNGAAIYGPEVTDGTINAVSRTQNYIGRSLWGDPNIQMMVDEVRVQKVARPAGWVKLEYQNQVPAGTAVVRTANLVPITVTVTGVNAANILGGPALSFKTLNNGLLFQIRGEAAAHARLAIVDMQGRVIWTRTVATGAGKTEVLWNGTSNQGQSVGAGVYVVRMSLLDDAGKPTQRLDQKVPLTR